MFSSIIIKDLKIIDSLYKKKNDGLELNENEINILEIYEIRDKIKSTLNLSLQFLKARDDNNYDLQEIYHILNENKEIIGLKVKTEELEEKRNIMFNNMINKRQKYSDDERKIEELEHKIFELQEEQFKLIRGNISFIMSLLFLVFLSKEFEVLPSEKIEDLQDFLEKRCL